MPALWHKVRSFCSLACQRLIPILPPLRAVSGRSEEMKARLASLLLLAAGLLAGPLAHALEQSAALLGAEDLKPLVGRSDVRLLDIRAPQDYAAGHVPGAVNTPYGQYRGPA